jgi:phosphoribosylformimino-5-aminoimidazole carboxamide ribotide isomerase
MEVVPSIDLRAGQVVRLKQGDFAQQTSYSVDPRDVARGFQVAGASIMHLVDLDGAKEGRVSQGALIREVVAAVTIPVQVGGGVRSTADVESLLTAGAARVVIGTAALENWAWFAGLVPAFPGKIVLAVDAKDGVIATRGWTASSGRTAVDVVRAVTGWPLAGVLYTDVAVDGMLTGPNYARTRELVVAAADGGGDPIPVIASGGVGDLSHLRELKKTACWGVIVGRAIYEGKVDPAQAIRLARE